MTPDEHFAATVEGHMKGTIFRVLETVGLSWREVRHLSIPKFYELIWTLALENRVTRV